MSVNINTTNNIVSVQTDNNSVIVTNNNTGTTVNVSRPIASVVTVSSPGPQGAVGPQGIQGETGPPTPFTNIGSGVYSTTSSIQISGSFLVSGSSTFTNIGPAIFSGSVTINGAPAVTTATLSSLTASSAETASYLNTLNQNLTFNGNLTLNGTASISYLNVQYETASVIYSSGSNQLGDAANDTQTLLGSVIVPTGSLTVTGSFRVTSTASFSGLSLHNQNRIDDVSMLNFDTTNNYYQVGKSGNDLLIRTAANNLALFGGKDTTIQTGVIGGHFYLKGGNVNGFGQSNFSIADYNGSNTRFFVSGSGNVGIGTTTPGYLLDVVSSTGYSAIGIKTAAATNAEINFQNAAYSLPRWTIRASAAADGASGNLVFQRFASTFPMTITSGDNVLIGTSTDSGYKLDVSGTMQVTGNINLPTSAQYIGRGISDAIRFANAEVRVSVSSLTGNFSVYGPSYGLTAFRVMANGNTLVGTTDDPGYKLHVSGSGNFNNNLTVTGSLTMGGSIFTSGYIGYPNNSRYLQFNDADSLVRLQGFNGIRLMTYDTTGYTDVIKIDGNVTTRTIQLSGSLRTSGSVTIQGPDRTLYTQAVTNTSTDGYLYFGDGTRIGSTGGSNIYYASGYYSQAAHQFYGGSATNMTSVVDIYGGQSGKPALRVSGSTQLTGSLTISGSNYIRFDNTGSGTNANYADLSVFRYATYDTPALKVARPDGIGFTLYRQGSANNFWVGDEAGNRNMTLYSLAMGSFTFTAPGQGGDLTFTGGSAVNAAYASSIVFSTFDVATTAATSADHSFKFNGPTVTGSTSYNMVSYQANSVEKAAIRYNGGAYFSSSVGIGTTTPAYALDVNGTIRSQGQLIVVGQIQNPTIGVVDVNGVLYSGTGVSIGVNSTNAARLLVRGSGTTSATTALRVENTNASASLVVLDNGYVGIGTSSAQYQLDVYGTYHQYQAQGGLARYDISSANANQNRGVWDFYTNAAVTPDFFGRFGFKFEGGTADSFKQFQVHVADSTTPKFVVDGSGRMGIGTITPTYKLDVSGSTFSRKLIVGTDNTYTGAITGSDFYVKGTSGGTVFVIRDSNNNNLVVVGGASGTGQFYVPAYNIGLGTSIANSANKVHIVSNGATSATTALLIQNSSPINLLSVLDNGQVSFTSPTMSIAVSQSAFSISPIISASNVVGGQYYGVNITPTFFQTTGSQTETAFRVAATYNQTSAVATGGTNIIADFGSTSAGSQLTVTDVTSGSIYMVNDVSGLPIIEATSNWDVNIYDFPNKIFEKTGSQVNIYGTLRVSGSFVLPLSQSIAPQIGSAYWSGSLLFIYNGTRYMSASFA